MVGLVALLAPVPHLEEEPLDVGRVGADAEERAVGARLPHLGAGAAEAGGKINRLKKVRTRRFAKHG